MKIEELELKTNLMPKNVSLAQVYSGGLEYAPLNEDNEMLNAFVTCKDFFNELVFSIVNNKKVGIWGFQMDPTIKDFKADINNLRIALRIKGSDDIDGLLDKIIKSVDFVNDSFKDLGFKKVEILGIGVLKEQKTVVITMPSDFSMYPPIMSAFLLYIRAGVTYDKSNELCKTPEDYINNLGKIPCKIRRASDPGDMAHSLALIKRMTTEGTEKFFKKDYKANYPATVNVGTLHNNFGIRSYMQTYEKKGLQFDEAIK